jgi:hypothetical protein
MLLAPALGDSCQPVEWRDRCPPRGVWAAVHEGPKQYSRAAALPSNQRSEGRQLLVIGGREARQPRPSKEETMRKLVIAVFSVLAFAVAVVPAANAAPRSSRLSLTASITSFHATTAGVVATGTFRGTMHSGSRVTHDSAPVRFAVLARSGGGRCNVLTLHLAPVFLELLGLQVQTSTINLNLYAQRGEVLGNLFCALSRAKVSFPRAARDLNARLHGRPLQVMAASDSVPARAAQAQPASCQVLKLVLGPLHLNLLGLVVDLYGETTSSPVVVTINAVPSQGLLGQLLCGLAGGTGINSLSGLQSLLSSLGLNLSNNQVTNLLNQLGITDLLTGLSQSDINRILDALGLGSVTPAG